MARLHSTCRSRTRRGFRPTLDLLETRLAPALFVVNTLADTVDPDPDVTSLREALQLANANPGGDTISFSVAGQINVLSQLPAINDATGNLFLNGNSAPGYAGTPVVSLFGPGTASNVSGLQIENSINNLVRGLQIGNFTRGIDIRTGANANAILGCYIGTDGVAAVPNFIGILTSGGAANTRIGTNGDGVNDAAEGNVISGNSVYGISSGGAGGEIIAGNKIGTNAAGTAALPHGSDGIHIGGGGFNRIGTNADGVSDALERNLISGNQGFGVAISGAAARNNDVLGNFIGTDVTGTAALPNGVGGVFIASGSFNNRIGSFSSAGRNVIAGNTAALAPFGIGGGIVFSDAGTTSNAVNNNAIGTDLTGTIDLGNASHGIQITNGAGVVQVAQNVIAFNDGDGVHMTSTAVTGVQITSTSFFANGGLGINLVSPSDNAAGVTPNDFLDADSGPNNLHNAPVISKAIATGTGTSIQYSLHSTPNTFFLMQFRVSPTADPSGFGEGKTFLAQRGLTTDANGNASETFTTGIIPIGQAVTATAMSSNTSEFSNAVKVARQITWTGGARIAAWSDPANWGGTAPEAGDHLVFGPGSPTNVLNDFAPDTIFASLTFTGGDYFVTGNRIALGDGGITVSAGSAYLEQDNHFDPICPPIVVEAGSLLTLAGILSGPGGMHKDGLGTAILSGANTYAGETHVEEGLLRITHGTALGTTAGGTEVGVDGTLELSGGISVVGETLSVVAAERTADIIAILIGHNIWGGAIELPNHLDPICPPISTAAGTSLTVSGVISGGSLTDLAKTGAGTLILDAANTYSGKTEIMDGALRITNGAALGTTAGATAITNRGVLELDGNFTVTGETLNVENLNQTDGIIAILIGIRSPTWAGPINLPQHFDPICPPISTPADSTLTISGVISGGSGAELLKLGAGTLILSAANTYAGKTEIMEGTLRVQNDAALGSTAMGTELHGGSMELKGGITVAGETLAFKDASSTPEGIRSVSGANSWTGAWTIDPIDVPIVVDSGSQLTASGVISGDGGMHKDGLGTFVLSGANTYAGVTHVAEGVLRLEHSMALGTTAMGTEMFGGTLALHGGINVVGETLAIEDNPSTVESIAGDNVWDGVWRNPVDHTIEVPIVVRPGSTLTVSTVIGGFDSLLKSGLGTFVLSGVNTYAGETKVLEGTLLVNGTSASAVMKVEGGVLGGTGTLGATEVLSGSLRPGTSPGLLSVAGDVTFAAGSSFVAELNGTTAGSQYDQLAVQGAVSLGGATLNASVGYASNPGDGFVIISNDGSDAVTGAFAGLAEGTTFALAGNPYRITYVGGDGNDVELVRLGVGVVGGRLIVDGTSADDRIRIISHGDDDCDADDPARVTVRMNGEVVGRFALNSFQQIVVHGLAGADHLHISNRIDKPAFLYGDAGNDTLKGGGGNDVLLGGVGDDRLHGHHGRDLLIGGLGGDRLIGEHDDDLLIASFTAFDNDHSALTAIMAEWTRTDQTYDQRVSHLRDGGGNNGAVVLVAESSGATVFDDGAEDRLTGNQGRDWFFANLSGSGVLDKITDWHGNEDGDDMDP